MTQMETTESFDWLIPEIKDIESTNNNTVMIKGIALRGNTVSLNDRHYVDEELKRTARTFNGRPITVNHADYNDKKNHIGKVHWMEYDKDGNMEYVGEIWKEPYVSMLRGNSTELHGVSIEANYNYNECNICHKKFFTEEDYKFHMIYKEFIKNSSLEPRGMLGRALSVVAFKETPGYEGSTLELMVMEMKQRGDDSRLLNVIVTQEKLKEEHQKTSKIALTQEQPHIAIGRSKKLNTNVKEQDEHGCGPDEHWDEATQACVANTATEQQECPEGEHWDEEKQACVANAVAEQDEPEACPAGQHRNEAGECVLDAEETTRKTQAITVREALKIGKLVHKPIKKPLFEQLREQGKTVEEAAGEIALIDELNASSEFTVQTVNEIINIVSRPLIVKIPSDDLGWKQIKPFNDKSLKAEIQGLKETLDNNAEVASKQYGELKEMLSKKDEVIQEYRKYVKVSDESVSLRDKKIAEMAETNKTVEQIKEISEAREKENKELKEQLEKQTTRADNAEDKLSKHSEFKGNAKTLEEKAATQDLGYTPEQNIKEKHKK